MRIPNDMIVNPGATENGTVVSIRDLRILLGATDEQLAESDRISALRASILEREPWRDKTEYVICHTYEDGTTMGYIKGDIDWSGTEMEAISKEARERMDAARLKKENGDN